VLDFTVIVPTFRRPRPLERCLAALAAQRFARDRYHVVVVDDSNEGALRSLVAGFEHQLDIELCEHAHAGPAAARNLGARRSRARLLAFTDDDCEPDPGWLEALFLRLNGHQDRAVGGRTVPAISDGPFSNLAQRLVEYVSTAPPGGHRAPRFLPSNNLALPRELFLSVEGFNERFELPAGEDREISSRITAAGARLVFAAEATVQHRHTLGLGDFLKVNYRYGRGACLLRDRSRSRGGEQPRLEPASFYLDLILSPLVSGHSERPLQDVLLMTMSQLATAAGYLRQGVPSGIDDLRHQLRSLRGD